MKLRAGVILMKKIIDKTFALQADVSGSIPGTLYDSLSPINNDPRAQSQE